MNIFDWVNLSVGIASLILAGFAIWLSIYFYNQAKQAESNAAQLLTSIRTETGMLRKLTGGWMDKLIAYSTQSHPNYENVLTTVLASYTQVKPMSSINAVDVSTDDQQLEHWKNQAIVGYVGIYFYSALANIALQSQIPHITEANKEAEAFKINLLNTSYQDVLDMSKSLDNFTQNQIKNTQLHNFYIMAEGWKSIVKNFEMLNEEREATLGEIS